MLENKEGTKFGGKDLRDVWSIKILAIAVVGKSIGK